MKKYNVYPGYVKSKNDGEYHYISANLLMKLYNVNPRLCLVFSGKKDMYKNFKKLIPLYPREDGNYNLKKQVPGCFLFSSEDWKI